MAEVASAQTKTSIPDRNRGSPASATGLEPATTGSTVRYSGRGGAGSTRAYGDRPGQPDRESDQRVCRPRIELDRFVLGRGSYARAGGDPRPHQGGGERSVPSAM